MTERQIIKLLEYTIEICKVLILVCRVKLNSTKFNLYKKYKLKKMLLKLHELRNLAISCRFMLKEPMQYEK